MSMGKRIGWSICIILMYFVTSIIYKSFKVAIEATSAVQQVKDSTLLYVFGQQMARGNVIPDIMFAVLFVSIGMIWRKPIMNLILGYNNKGNVAMCALIALGALATSSCGPAKILPLEKVGPNETAFVIPLEGATSNQAKFESVEFLNAHKVMAKQIEIPVRDRSLGRAWWDYEYIPTVRVIKVDRSLVTREWTKGSGSGTSSKDEALSVASLDSINFHIGVNLTVSILEEDAPVYLYWHGQKTLAEVVDTNVRGYLQGIMSDEFGKLNLEACKIKKAEIFQKANTATIDKFKKVGITVSYVGSAQGLMFDDASIQQKINETQTAEMAIQVATKKNLEQIELNKAIVSKAVADRMAATEFAQASEAQKAQISLEIEKIRAQAMLKAAENLKDMNGQLSSVLPPGATLLFGLDKPYKTSTKE